MANKKKSYKIVAHTSYRGQEPREYVVKSGMGKRQANAYMKEYCYTTVTRTFTVEEE